MRKQLFALFLLVLLLGPMFWGIFQLRRVRRILRDRPADAAPDADKDDNDAAAA